MYTSTPKRAPFSASSCRAIASRNARSTRSIDAGSLDIFMLNALTRRCGRCFSGSMVSPRRAHSRPKR